MTKYVNRGKGGEAWLIPTRGNRRFRTQRSISASRSTTLDLALGEIKPGDLLGERFEIIEQLGVGGMSVVYRARDKNHKTEVALKFMCPALLHDPVAVQLFINEAKIASSLAHPGIVKVYEVHQEQGLYFLQMELFKGINLRQWMEKNDRAVQPLKLEQVNSLIQSVCRTLSYAHQSTIHRDLKPENIGIIDVNDTKLMDFGLAQILHQRQSTLFRESVSQISAGTPYYMAPEILTHHGPIDGRADQYSIAVVAYELVNGDLPLGLFSSLSKRRPDLPLRFTQTIDQALSNHPEQRFPTIQDFANALEKGAQPEPFVRKIYRLAYHAPTWTKKLATFLIALSLVFPVGKLIHRQGQQRSQAIQQAYQAQTLAEQQAYQIQQAIDSLNLEAKVLARTMSIEATAHLNSEASAEPSKSPKWLSASNQWHAVMTACHWIDPKTNSEGEWHELKALLAASRQRIESNQIEDSQSLLTVFDTESKQILTLIHNIRNIFELSDRIQRYSAIIEPQEVGITSTLIDDLSKINSKRILNALVLQDESIQAVFRSKKTSALEAYANAKQEWEDLFSNQLPAPDLFFLYDVNKAYNRAADYFSAGEWEKAFRLLNKTTITLKRWTMEVVRGREHAASTWSKTKYRFEAKGMRFVRVNDIYWSIWEIRVMDFARWLSFNREISHLVLMELDLDPDQLGPTHPITGIDRQTANAIAQWTGYSMTEFARPRSGLPTSTHWQNLWKSESLPGDYRFGIMPQPSPERMIILNDYYLDPFLRANSYLHQVGIGEESTHGLYDLTGNAWEWSDSALLLDRSESTNNEPLKWMLHGGQGYGEIRFHSFEPPRPNTVFINRAEAIGIRVVLYPNAVIDKASGFAQQ